MANVIVGIHGLGNKPKKSILEQWWKLSMEEGLRLSGFNRPLPKFELVYWADIIYETPLDIREQDNESPRFVHEPFTKTPELRPAENHERRKKVVEFLGRQMNKIFLNDDLSLNFSFIADAVLNRYFRDLEIYYEENSIGPDGNTYPAKDLIRQRLRLTLEKYRQDNILLIAHSMGSIIAYDVLTFILPEISVSSLVTMGSPLGMPVVISKIAAERNKTGLHTDRLITPPSVKGNWINYFDVLDMVALNYRLSGIFSQNILGIKPVDLLVTNTYEVNGQQNPHKSFGYLRTSEFSRLLYEFISSEKLTIKEKVTHKFKSMLSGLKDQISPDGGRVKRQSSPF